MRILIGDEAGGGLRDYSGSLCQESVRVVRKLHEAATLRVELLAEDADFLVPREGEELALEQDNGTRLFTGRLTERAAFDYMGWGERGPVFRYSIAASSDEWWLDQMEGKERPAFVRQAAGDVLKAITTDRMPEVDGSAVVPGPLMTSLLARPGRPWTEAARWLAVRSRMSFRLHDGQLVLAPIGATTHVLNEQHDGFEPQSLQVSKRAARANRVTVLGRVEPHAYVEDRFQGDDYSLRFDLSNLPFGRRTSLIVEDEFEGASVDTLRWRVSGASAALEVAAGKLLFAGGSAAQGSTRLELAEVVEMGGALVAQVGDVSFNGPSDGVLCGFFAGGSGVANCAVGFRVRNSGGQNNIVPLVNGAETGQTLVALSGHALLLTARVFASEWFRREQTYHSSGHATGSGRGGAENAASARVVLEVHDVDPQQPGTQAAPATVLYDGTLANLPAFCTFTLASGGVMDLQAGFARVTSGGTLQVRSTIPGFATRTRLMGYASEGGECSLWGDATLRFHSPYVPVAGEQIVVRYRSGRRAAAEVTDPASVTASGESRATIRVVQPPTRTSAECELAALSLLDDSAQPAWSGSYECWSEMLPGNAGDIWPGDGLMLDVPSRDAEFTAVVRRVEIEAGKGAGQLRYRIAFANEAAESLALETVDAVPGRAPETLAAVGAASAWANDLPEATITAMTSTTITIDAGEAPPAGGGFEVRQSDYGWGAATDRNLTGRFTTRVFTITRLARVQGICLRGYTATPRRYSRHSTALYVDVPYQV